jgi:hypothetical protein
MNERKTFADSVLPLPETGGPTSMGFVLSPAAPHPDEVMTLHFSLSVDPDLVKDLERTVAAGEVIPAGELDSLYSSRTANSKPLVSKGGLPLTATRLSPKGERL